MRFRFGVPRVVLIRSLRVAGDMNLEADYDSCEFAPRRTALQVGSADR